MTNIQNEISEYICNFNPALSPCPFCSRTPVIKGRPLSENLSARFYVSCLNCGAMSGPRLDIYTAIGNWNERE
ncbi:MAG: Lar family restriction alleviation protein [Oscillospiraceae bacterium]|nr:Lar family restriction alleviation protein [Oscillospiraceae bacterium]